MKGPGLSDSEDVADAIRRVITDHKSHANSEIPEFNVFGMCCMPRDSKPKPILETAHPEAVLIGADLIGQPHRPGRQPGR
ncbi:hypothetical protein [Mycolicibacterium porcinum]|uniref:Uncharacterized protein n=1 Tax=Mycolicibacterium porcinum TaxID=39693 RepID=A0ABV3VL58_9MYCO